MVSERLFFFLDLAYSLICKTNLLGEAWHPFYRTNLHSKYGKQLVNRICCVDKRIFLKVLQNRTIDSSDENKEMNRFEDKNTVHTVSVYLWHQFATLLWYVLYRVIQKLLLIFIHDAFCYPVLEQNSRLYFVIE